MTSRFVPVGRGTIFKDRQTGELVFDDENVRRPNVGFAGDDMEGDDETGDDDFGEDLEGDDETGDDETGEQSIDDLGANRRGKKKKKKGGRGQSHGQGRPQQRHQQQPHRQERSSDMASKDDHEWGATVVSNSQTLGAAGSATVSIRLQHDFRAEDITFDGSTNGAKVTAIFFGEVPVFSSPTGIPVSVLSAQSQVRKVLKGQSCKAGLDITVNGSLPGAGDFVATLTGSKPLRHS